MNSDYDAEARANPITTVLEELLPESSHLRNYPAELSREFRRLPCPEASRGLFSPVAMLRHIAKCKICNMGNQALQTFLRRVGANNPKRLSDLKAKLGSTTLHAGMVPSSRVAAFASETRSGALILLHHGLEAALKIIVESMLFGLPADDWLALAESAKGFYFGQGAFATLLQKPIRMWRLNAQRLALLEVMSHRNLQLTIAEKIDLVSRFYRDLGIVRSDRTLLPIPTHYSSVGLSSVGTILEPAQLLVTVMIDFEPMRKV